MKEASIDVAIYHDVCGAKDSLPRYSNPRYTTPLARLRRHLEWTTKMGFKAIRLSDWLDARAGGEAWGGKYILLTLDGPHAGWFEHAIPLLVEQELPATFFVTAGWIGADHPYPESRHLNWKDIKEIEAFTDSQGRPLFDVGCHSMWHTPLSSAPGGDERSHGTRLQEEIVDACDRLRQETGLAIRSYAPPKGEGLLSLLRPLLEIAGIEAVRWANLPGATNEFGGELFDIQISYCDSTDQPDDRLKTILSQRHPKWFQKLRVKLNRFAGRMTRPA